MRALALGALLALHAAGVARADAIEDRYARTCIVCHAAGVAGAPRTGDAAEWAPRLAKGMDALLESVDKGMSGMPPKAMCFDCSAEEIRALIEYMAAPR